MKNKPKISKLYSDLKAIKYKKTKKGYSVKYEMTADLVKYKGIADAIPYNPPYIPLSPDVNPIGFIIGSLK